MITSLSRRDSTLLKGLAICAIFLHNYCHWMPRCVPENEYSFTESNVQMMAHYVSCGGPHVLMNLVSFFGHYGVPIFLFISGYGLVKKHEHTEIDNWGMWNFLSRNVLKLWKLLVPAVVIFLIIYALNHGWIVRYKCIDAFYVLTFVSNLLPSHYNLLGPWWYFSLTLQLYLFYRLVFYRQRSKATIAYTTAVCTLMQVIAISFLDSPKHEVLEYLRYNFVGSILPFAAGVWAARYGMRLPVWTIVPSLILLVACSLNVYLWLLTPLFAIGTAIPLVRLIPNKGSGIWLWLGGISASLFVTHPLARPYFADWAKAAYHSDSSIYPALAGYILACLLAAWIYDKLQTLLSRKKLDHSKKRA